MQPVSVMNVPDSRNYRDWQARGLLALYGFGVASLLAAIVTFIAHNWVYLGTGLKLGGIGAALLICAVIWIVRGFDRPSAQSFGIAAQILIGVWLAAAGQIYQAPGGLQDLLLIWAVLGLPFALASRSAAHWAVWFCVIWLAAMSSTGLRLLSIIGPDWTAAVMLTGAFILSVSLFVAQRLRAPLWLRVLLAVGVGTLCIGSSWVGLFDDVLLWGYGASLIGLIILGVTGQQTYQRRTVSTSAVLATAMMVIAVFVIGYSLADTILGGVILAFVMTVIVGGATYALVLIFKHLRGFVIADEAPIQTSELIQGDNPWYMDAFIGAGGVLTAIFGCVLVGVIIGLSGLLEANWELSCLVIGVALYAACVWMRRVQSGQFLRFLFGTFILVGIGCSAFGVGALANSQTVEGLTLLLLSVLTAWLIDDDKILTALMAVASCLSLALIVSDLASLGHTVSILLVIYTVTGLAFGTVSLRGNVQIGAASIFLIAAIIAGQGADNGWGGMLVVNDLSVRGVEAIVGLLGAGWLWHRYGRDTGPSLPVLIALIVIAIILPIGAVPAMLLLLLAYMIGSRALFLIGLLAMIWFLFSAYFDLSLTLMALSAVMAVVGAGLLSLWAFARQRAEAA